jgi:hypothetical protein
MPTINADTDPIKTFARKLRKAAPETSKALKAGILEAVNEVRDDARAAAAQFSSTIPPTVRSSVSGNTGIVRAGNAKVPIAVLYERNAAFRHPLFGNKNAYYAQPGAPRHYLTATAAAAHDQVVETIGSAVFDAIDTVVGGDT